MARQLSRRIPLAELHCHLGGAVTPAIMWGIAHAQGIKLPTKDYWEFRDMITISKRSQSFDGYLQLFHWTELIQSSPIAVERAVYEVVGGAYRKNNITTMELRFNPMKRNRGGEQDLDHIIAAAVRGMDRAVLEYPQVRAGLIFCLDRGFSIGLNEIIAAKAIAWQSRGVVGIDIAGPVVEGFAFADYADIYRACRRAGLGLTVHAGETGGADEVYEALVALEPDRIGHGVHGADDPTVVGMLRERGTVLEVCPSSNLNTGVLRNLSDVRRVVRALIDGGVRFTVSTDGPEMLRSYLRDELALLMRNDILSIDEVRRAIEVAEEATFLDRAPVIDSSVAGRVAPIADGHAAMPVEVHS
jgi:adenosine deaminase